MRETPTAAEPERDLAMHEIKAFVRRERLDAIVHALRKAGVVHMTVSHVQSLGSSADAKSTLLSLEMAMTYIEHAKLELVCAEEDSHVLIAYLQAAAHTGQPGDEIIFVSPVERTLKIRTGAEGREALR